MPKEVVIVLIAFVVIAIISFMFYSLRVDRMKSEEGSLSEDSKVVALKLLRWVIMAVSFVVFSFFLISLESLFFEPNKGLVMAAFCASFVGAKYVGYLLKKWKKIKEV
nr:MAG TPA: hypothetical protein [Bacteriophage sp.]